MFRSIRSKIIILFLLFSFVPLVLSRWVIIHPKIWKAFQEARIGDLESIGHKQAELITVWMHERRADAQSIANEFLTRSFPQHPEGTESANRLTSYLRFIRDTYGYKEISISDTEGKINISTRKDLIGVSLKEFDYFQEALKGKTFVTDVRPSVFPIENEYGEMERGAPTLLVSTPIRDDSNRIIGVVSLRVDVIALSREMRRVKMGETGETYLVDKNGYMITESRFVTTIRDMGLIKKRTALELKLIDPKTGKLTKGVQECLKEESGYDAKGYPDYRGVQVLGFWCWIPEFEWGLLSEIDVDEAYKALYELDRTLLPISIALSLCIVAAVVFLGRKITDPIVHLTEVTEKMSSGDLRQRAVVRSQDEIGKLAESFNTMVETIEKRNEELESTKQYLESMFDSIRDPITVMDREGIILRVNQATIDEYGEDIIGRRCYEVFKDAGAMCDVCQNRELLEGLKPIFAEHYIPGKDKFIFTEAYPLLDSRGLQAIIMVMRDITQQKHLEKKLQQYTQDLEKTVEERTKALSLINKELEEKNRQLEKANVELRTLDKLKDRIIRDVSHELKGPVAQVKMAFDLRAEEKEKGKLDQEKERKLSAIINHNILRLQKTITGVLDLSSIESGQIKYKKERLHLNEIIQKVIMGYTLAAEQKGLSLRLEVPERLPEIVGDKEHLTRVVSNLIDNAIKYTPKGEVLVSVAYRDTEIEVKVRDSGMGIGLPKEEYGKLFERFFQEKPRYDGVGVGLAICKAIVETHGGRMWAESAGPGKGATFAFTIPLPKDKL
ncbi:MAG: ATP-binding protein [Candidatus Brocadiales bacterium]|nr:ATP-binding protein [Candidatus Brocadiales bacterium]